MPAAVFTANKRVPSGESRIGLVCAPSKLEETTGRAVCAWIAPHAMTRHIVEAYRFCGMCMMNLGVELEIDYASFMALHTNTKPILGADASRESYVEYDV